MRTISTPKISEIFIEVRSIGNRVIGSPSLRTHQLTECIMTN